MIYISLVKIEFTDNKTLEVIYHPCEEECVSLNGANMSADDLEKVASELMNAASIAKRALKNDLKLCEMMKEEHQKSKKKFEAFEAITSN